MPFVQTPLNPFAPAGLGLSCLPEQCKNFVGSITTSDAATVIRYYTYGIIERTRKSENRKKATDDRHIYICTMQYNIPPYGAHPPVSTSTHSQHRITRTYIHTYRCSDISVARSRHLAIKVVCGAVPVYCTYRSMYIHMYILCLARLPSIPDTGTMCNVHIPN